MLIHPLFFNKNNINLGEKLIMGNTHKISTNPYTLSLVKNILSEIEINNIPLFKDKDTDLREYVTTSIILELCNDIKKLNAMFRSITQDPEIDFALLKFNELFEILNDFFMNTGDKLISWKKIQNSELSGQKDMDMLQMMEMVTKNPELMKMFDTPTESTLKA